MEADFSGYATKAGLKCSDGRTIMPDAFKHQDTMRVPLVWQHGHNDPENVLGHAILENRADGVYCYGFFNNSQKAQHAHDALEHKDITMMSIWANELIERAGKVLHGAIREVSLVLSGANPGAKIETVSIRHSDGDETVVEDEGIIYTGLPFDHSLEDTDKKDVKHDAASSAAVEDAKDGGVDDASENADGSEKTVQEIYDGMDEEEKQVVHYLIGEAIMEASGSGDDSAKHDNTNDDVTDTKEGSQEMKHNNVFETKDGDTRKPVILSHADKEGIIADAIKCGSMKDAVEKYAEAHLEHGINDIDLLFPEAVATDADPSFLQRRVEWVGTLLGATRKSPFSRIKTLAADITVDEARAKGYITGALKKEEFFGIIRRVTTPTTIYKKQKLDRDDVVDITDFDVVAWLKTEMRLMLDEELARSILMGDGRDISDADKISESNIRPIANDHELFVTTVTVNLLDSSSSIQELIDATIRNRRQYKGTGLPTFFTSETVISSFLLLKDTLGRSIYPDLASVAAVLRVQAIVPVEAMDDDATLIGVMVNPIDYVVGATAGGAVNMFDFFDIDFNQQKYLIETRCCGALTRLKSAIVFRQSASTDTAVVPNAPTYNDATGVVTIVATTNVVYKNADTGATLSTGAQTALTEGQTLNVEAVPAAGHFVDSDANAYWTFTFNA